MRKTDTTYYMTAGVKSKLLNHSEDIQNALERFRNGDYGENIAKPENALITASGAYEMPFGTLWIINYDLFRNRDFITLLLPEEYDRS